MRIIGVTGGVGSGKSAVLNYIEEHFDSRIVKADDVGHVLMMPGENAMSLSSNCSGTGLSMRTAP